MLENILGQIMKIWPIKIVGLHDGTLPWSHCSKTKHDRIVECTSSGTYMEIHGFKAALHIVREARFQFNNISFHFNKLKKIKSKPNEENSVTKKSIKPNIGFWDQWNSLALTMKIKNKK